jgi:DNA-binding transcriptional regulator YiaG
MTVSGIVSKLRTGELAADLGVDPSTVSKWKDRESIPGEYWLGIVRFAEQRGISGITLEALASLHCKPALAEARA